MKDFLSQIHYKDLSIARNYRKIEAGLIDILLEIDKHKVFLSLGYNSLFEYCLKELNLAENTAYNFINVARKAKQVPELKKEIQKGTLCVSKARRIVPVITQKNSSKWLEMAKTMPQKKLEKEIAKVQPKVATPEKAVYINEKRLKLQLGVDEELMQKLERIKDLISQQKKKAVTLEEALEAMAEVYLDKKDPVIKAERVLKNKKTANQLGDRQVSRDHTMDKAKKPIAARTKHQVYLRDQGRCCHRDLQGKRCKNRRYHQIYHILEKSQGGGDHVDNLITLCVNHHRLIHWQTGWKEDSKTKRLILDQKSNQKFGQNEIRWGNI